MPTLTNTLHTQAEGNSFFKAGKYAEAIEKYKAATAADGTVPAYWSNMAASYEKLGDHANMEEAGRSCVLADSKFVKGYFRLATALKAQGKNAECIRTLESGLGVDSSNADLKRMKKDMIEIQRQEQAAQYVASERSNEAKRRCCSYISNSLQQQVLQ